MFHGLSAANIVPYAPIAGATWFTIYATWKAAEHHWDSKKHRQKDFFEKNYYVSCIGAPVFLLLKYTWKVVEFVWDNLLSPVVQRVIRAFGGIKFNHPVWIGVTVLGIAYVALRVIGGARVPSLPAVP